MVRWLKLGILVLVVLSFLGSYLYYSNRIDYLTVARNSIIEVNGAPLNGEVLEGRAVAIVTTRRGGEAHSYELLFAGDTDMTGNMGLVIDCHEWVAPPLSVLLKTQNYPPCKRLSGNAGERLGWPLMNVDKSMQFMTNDGKTIKVTRTTLAGGAR